LLAPDEKSTQEAVDASQPFNELSIFKQQLATNLHFRNKNAD